MHSPVGAGDDEDEELIPRQKVFWGMKFHDEQSRATARKVAMASVSLGVLVIGHFFLHLGKKGKLLNGLGHLVIGLVLPLIGYRGATLEDGASWRARVMWLFHIGNLVFVLVHAAVLVVVLLQVTALETTSVESMCDFSHANRLWLRSADQPGPEVMPTMPPDFGDSAACAEAVQQEKEHAPGLTMLWLLFTLPYWACAAYAAYFSHDLYLQLRVRELTVQRGEDVGIMSGGERRATVKWGEVSVNSPSTVPAL